MSKSASNGPTIRDVAKRANVGLATVSRVLNGSAPVAEDTRNKVLQSISELNYTPSPTARKLSLGKTFVISIIIPFFTRPSFIERLRGIDSVMANSDYDFIVFNVETMEKRDQYFSTVPRPDRSDGVIIVSLPTKDEDIELFRNKRVPVVLIDTQHPALTSVIEDSVKGGDDATEHLIALGHRRIAYVSDILHDPLAHNYTASRNRLMGYRQSLDRAGVAFNPDYHCFCHHDRPTTRAMMRDVLARPERPTAVFCASDTQALGTMEAARDLGLRVPEDLSVVGYDDIEIAEYVGLTTMRQALFESGKRGAELMLQHLGGQLAVPHVECLSTNLVIRNTTCPPQDPT